MLTLNYDTKHIEGSYEETAANIDNFKFFQCRFDGDAKKWRLPINATKLEQLEDYVDEWNSNEDLRNKAIANVQAQEQVKLQAKKAASQELWKQACGLLSIKYAKKGTKEYELVKEQFKKLCNPKPENQPKPSVQLDTNDYESDKEDNYKSETVYYYKSAGSVTGMGRN